jgi:hypothetical protein
METQQLIANLVGEGAKKPMPGVLRQMGLWLAVTFVWITLVACHSGLRPDIMQKLHATFFIPELLFLGAISFSSAAAALFLSRPDAMQKPKIRWLPLLFVIPWAVLATLNMGPMDGSLAQTMNSMRFDCAGCILLCAAVPAAAMFLMVRKGAAASTGWAGGMTAFSVATFAYLCMRVIEQNDDPLHLVMWHALPVFILCFIGIAAGKTILRWR